MELGAISNSQLQFSGHPPPQRGCFTNLVSVNNQAGFRLTELNHKLRIIHPIAYTGNQFGQTITRYNPPSDNNQGPGPSSLTSAPSEVPVLTAYGGDTVIETPPTSKKRGQTQAGNHGSNKKPKIYSPTGKEFTDAVETQINTIRQNVDLGKLNNSAGLPFSSRMRKHLLAADKNKKKDKISAVERNQDGTRTHGLRIHLPKDVDPSTFHHYLLLDPSFPYGPFVFSDNVLSLHINAHKGQNRWSVLVVFLVHDVQEQSIQLDTKMTDLRVRLSSLIHFQSVPHLTELGMLNGKSLLVKKRFANSQHVWWTAYFFKEGDDRDDMKTMIPLLKPLLHPDMLPFVIMHYQEQFDDAGIEQEARTKQAIAEDFACPNYEVLFDEVYNKENVMDFRGE